MSPNASVPAALPPERVPSVPPTGQPSSSTNGLWLAIYTLAGGVCTVAALLIARAVHATGMETATASGGTFLAVLALGITAHRFLKDR